MLPPSPADRRKPPVLPAEAHAPPEAARIAAAALGRGSRPRCRRRAYRLPRKRVSPKRPSRAEDLRLVAGMVEADAAALAACLAAKVDDDTQDKPQREGFFARLKRSLVRTRENIGSGFFGLFRGKKDRRRAV